MNLIQQEAYFDTMVNSMRDTMLKKGNDYSNVDRLSNFKLSGAIVGSTPEQTCLTLIAIKVSRLGILLNTNSKPNNESIQDTLLDLANYTILLGMIIQDSKNLKNKRYDHS